MNQPSGLSSDGTRLYVADSEASAIRVVEPGPNGQIDTIIGEGLFDFGDEDGVGPKTVRLQHPLGLVWHEGVVYIADTYNHKIKRLDPSTADIRTFLGTGEPGYEDESAPRRPILRAERPQRRKRPAVHRRHEQQRDPRGRPRIRGVRTLDLRSLDAPDD